MSTREEDLKRKVNVKKVVKAVKNIGSFALYRSSEDSTLLITRDFILNLNAHQAWETQCALLVKDLGMWYTVHKDGPIEGNPIEDSDINVYYQAVKDTDLNIIGFTELYLNSTALYAADGGYVGIKGEYIEMIGGLCPIRKSPQKSLVVASDYHVFVPTQEIQSEYLASLLF